MDKKAYLAKRNALISEAEALLNEGNLEEYEKKEQEIKDLDEQFEKISKAQANMNALKGNAVASDDVRAMQVNGNNAGAVSTIPEKETAKDEKKEYLTAWAKVMMGRHLDSDEQIVFDKINADFRKSSFNNTLQTVQTHAVVIPETVADDIWREAKELYPIINDLDITFVPGDFTILQETDSGADAAWYDEDTEVTDGDFAIGELNLTGCELAKNIPISWKLRKMSMEKFIPYITKLLAEKMAAALAKGTVSGKGKPGVSDSFKPEPKGVETALTAESGTPQIVTYSEGEEGGLGYDEIAEAMGKIKSAYKTGAAMYANNVTVWDKLAKIKDGQGRPMFILDVTSGGVGRLFGLTVKEDDSIGEGKILIGNLKRGYACNVNENMTIYTEDHVKGRYTDYMEYAIIDGAPKTTKAFALIKPEEEEI